MVNSFQMINIIRIISLCLWVQAQGQNYLSYHADINLAEHYFVNKQPDSAYYYYDKAFDAYDFIFVKDALIAAQFAWKQKNASKTEKYLIKGAESGLRTECLNGIPILENYMNTTAFNATYDSMKNALTRYRHYDNVLSEEWVRRGSALIMSENKAESISAIQDNARRVRELLKSGKYPGEKYIGINSNCAEMENLNVFNSLANYDCVITEMYNLLWNAVIKGELHPREFATLWEWEYIRSAHKIETINSYVLGLMMKQKIAVSMKDLASAKNNINCSPSRQKFNRFRLLIPSSDISLEEINRNRKEYFICDTDTDDKKMQLQEKEGYKLFWTVK